MVKDTLTQIDNLVIEKDIRDLSLYLYDESEAYITIPELDELATAYRQLESERDKLREFLESTTMVHFRLDGNATVIYADDNHTFTVYGNGRKDSKGHTHFMDALAALTK